ncbi:TSL-kinase interacting protein 1-like [Oryza glaberrima]|uniref:TSL-kinase interacting protein 1 n=2 Tax=Oryza TaxID=4527 RepID=A0A0D3GTY4_9ORYZ|nr:TSL-kinase interacting protein 1-like [Oryza glaberrima]
MKPQQHRKATETGANIKLGCSKMQSLKPGKYINKPSGNANTKCRGAVTPPQLYTENPMALKGGSTMEAQFCDSKNFSNRQPNHSGKIKLELFPIDKAIQKVLQQENRNPYLELTLAPRKKISSVVQHLNIKWGNSQCARGELMLFPYDAQLDNIAGSGKWTHSDSCTAADVHAAVGSPLRFRLRYGWFEPDFEQQSHGPNLQDVHSVDKIIDNKPLDPVLMEQKQMVHLSEFPNDFAAQSVGDNAVHTVGNQSKVTPLSWIDCISNISFEELLSEAAPSADNKQLLSQNNSQIPINFDSFDAAIASVIGQQQASNQMKVSNPSLWDAEEACHAFPLQSQTSIRTFGSGPNHSDAITSSILGTIPECVTDVDQQCFTEVWEEEPSPHIPLSCRDNVAPYISLPEFGEPELGAYCSRLLSGTDSLGLSGLLSNSLDAFQKFSVF